MPSSANETSLLPFLKRQYPNGVAWTGYKKSKLFSMIETDTNFGGEGKYTNVSIGPTSGGSADYQKAYANQGPSAQRRFFITHRTEYQIARLKGSIIAKTKGDKNALKMALTEEFDKAGYAFGRTMGAALYGNGGGSLGIIDSTTTLTGAVLRLSRQADVAKFEIGMWIELAADDGTGTSPSGVLTGQLQVLKVNSNNAGFAELTLNANINTIPSAATGNFIFRAGDYGQKMSGLSGWCPLTAPGGTDSFNGVNRSDHMIRLAGNRKTGNGGSKEATLLDAAAEAAAQGCEAELCSVNPLDYNSLIKEFGSDRVVDVETRNPDMGFKAIRVETAMGTVDFCSEVDVPRGEFFFSKPSEITIRTAGDCPRPLDFDGGGKLVKVQGEDSYQFDLGAYGNFDIANPINLIHGSF